MLVSAVINKFGDVNPFQTATRFFLTFFQHKTSHLEGIPRSKSHQYMNQCGLLEENNMEESGPPTALGQ